MKNETAPFVIVNPNSANGRTGRLWPAMRVEIGRHFPGFHAALTERAGHATDLTRQALRDGYHRIISLGGDGTNNEVVNGFFDENGQILRDDIELGILPGGTGGDFCRLLGIPRSHRGAVAYLARAEPKAADLGRMTCIDHAGETITRYFLNVCSFGISGSVDNYVNRTTKLFGGRASFLIATVRAFVRYRNKTIRLRIDDDFDQNIRINSVAVANGQFFGGGMHIAPTAKISDGEFEIVVIGDISKRQAVLTGPLLYKGGHVNQPEVSVIAGRRVVAESDDEVLIDLDGEQPGRLPITIDMLPGVIKVLHCLEDLS